MGSVPKTLPMPSFFTIGCGEELVPKQTFQSWVSVANENQSNTISKRGQAMSTQRIAHERSYPAMIHAMTTLNVAMCSVDERKGVSHLFEQLESFFAISLELFRSTVRRSCSNAAMQCDFFPWCERSKFSKKLLRIKKIRDFS